MTVTDDHDSTSTVRSATTPAHFVLMGEPDLARLSNLDPDRDWPEFVTGERAWVLQSYLRLRAAGLPVQLTDRLPLQGIAFFSGKQRRKLLGSHRQLRTQALLVAIREDVRSTPFSDFELVQNPSQVEVGRTALMPLWPQPGLIPRDSTRGNRIAQVTYKGFIRNLHPSFHTGEWQAFLTARDLTWTADAVDYAGSGRTHRGITWNDFSNTDVVVAVRPDDADGHPHKPATKLYNAWLAGTPALLGPEVAYRELRRDPLDYLEVRDCREAMAAVDALLADPARYQAMIRHGHERAREFTIDRFIDRWRLLIEETLPPLAADKAGQQPTPLWLRQTAGRLRRAPSDMRDTLLGRRKRTAPRSTQRVQMRTTEASAAPQPVSTATGQQVAPAGARNHEPRLLVLSYNPQLPSFRYRVQPVIELLRHRGWACDVHRLSKRSYGLRILRLARVLRSADVVLVVKVQVTPPEAWLLRRFSQRLALDVDDAIYVRKPRAPGEAADDSRWRRAKFAATCRAMDVVMAGNQVLASAAATHAPRIEIVPTPIDVNRYQPSNLDPARPPVIVWIGRPENLKYLELVRPALAQLQMRWPTLRLRIVCSHFPLWDDVITEQVTWSPDAEVAALVTADIGIMPLYDDEWTRGKCAFKLLQYAAAALPCVASDVGANREAVLHGCTGYLANTLEEWQQSLAALLADGDQRRRFGLAGLAHVRATFDADVVIPRAAQLIDDLAQWNPR